VRCGEVGAHNSAARHATFLRGVDRWNGMWRDGISPVGSGARARRVKTSVVSWATAESPAAGCGADRDRMTSCAVEARKRAAGGAGSGPGAVMSPLRTIRPLEQAIARSRVGRTSQPFTTVVLTDLVRAGAGTWPDRRRHALGEQGLLCLFTWICPYWRRAARGSSAGRTRPWPQCRSRRMWSAVARSRNFVMNTNGRDS
jgi:hypothetical protein